MASRWRRQRWPAKRMRTIVTSCKGGGGFRLQPFFLVIGIQLPAGELKADVRPGGQPSGRRQPLGACCPVRLFRFLTMLVAAIVLHKRVMRAVQRAWAV